MQPSVFSFYNFQRISEASVQRPGSPNSLAPQIRHHLEKTPSGLEQRSSGSEIQTAHHQLPQIHQRQSVHQLQPLHQPQTVHHQLQPEHQFQSLYPALQSSHGDAFIRSESSGHSRGQLQIQLLQQAAAEASSLNSTGSLSYSSAQGHFVTSNVGATGMQSSAGIHPGMYTTCTNVLVLHRMHACMHACIIYKLDNWNYSK